MAAKKKTKARGAKRKNNEPRQKWAVRLDMAFEGAGYPRGTYPALAEEVGVGAATISSWVNGRTQPKAHMWGKIRRITGTSIDWIITGEGSPPASVMREPFLAEG